MWEKTTPFTAGSIASVFKDDDGPYDWVFNCAAETKYSQTDEVIFFLPFSCQLLTTMA